MSLKVVRAGLVSKRTKCPGCGGDIHLFFDEEKGLRKIEGGISKCEIKGEVHLECKDCYCVFEIPKLEDL